MFTGQIGGLAGKIESEREDFKNMKISFTADVNTISSSNE